jgi:anti-anti-sigma regulatory factor
MQSVHIENKVDLEVVLCEGRVVRNEAAFKLREAVTSQRDARIIVLDLSEVRAIEGSGLGLLVFLQRWAYDHDIRLKLFNPAKSVQDRLEHASSVPEFDIATLDEMMALLARTDNRYALGVPEKRLTQPTLLEMAILRQLWAAHCAVGLARYAGSIPQFFDFRPTENASTRQMC